MTKHEEKLDEARRLLLDTELQFLQEINGEDEAYWQGRKDSARLMFGIFNSEYTEKAKTLTESSPGYILLDSETIKDLLVDAVYNIAAIVYEINHETPHPQTMHNLKEFVKKYDRLSKDGKLPVVDDHC